MDCIGHIYNKPSPYDSTHTFRTTSKYMELNAIKWINYKTDKSSYSTVLHFDNLRLPLINSHHDLQIMQIIDKFVQSMKSGLFNPKFFTNSLKLFKHEVKDFYKKQYNEKLSCLHIGTVILIAPSNLYEYKGGILTVYFENGVKINVTQDAYRWSYIYFNCDVQYEITPVTYGTRITLVYQIYKSWYDDITHMINASELMLDNTKIDKDIDSKIISVKNKIEELQNTLKIYEMTKLVQCNEDIKCMYCCEPIEIGWDVTIIRLQHYYKDGDTKFKENDLLFFNKMSDKKYQILFKNINLNKKFNKNIKF